MIGVIGGNGVLQQLIGCVKYYKHQLIQVSHSANI